MRNISNEYETEREREGERVVRENTQNCGHCFSGSESKATSQESFGNRNIENLC
jgi:hypothetical protein